MSERKVLNKYYPPDFDPTKIPKLKQGRNRQYTIRIMAPFNMRCNTCGEYIYKGKKFNSKKETVEDETYLGLYIFRFYIKCPRCVAEIAFKTDPENTDYTLEDGATRNFEALRTAEELAQKEALAKEEEEKNNPMKLLENRTKASQREMDMLETLGDLRELNSRHAKLDHDSVIKLHAAYEEQLKKLQDEEDEAFVQSIFGNTGSSSFKRLQDDGEEDAVPKKVTKVDKPSDILTQASESKVSKPKKVAASWERSVGSLSTSKSKLSMLVKKKQPQPSDGKQEKHCQPPKVASLKKQPPSGPSSSQAESNPPSVTKANHTESDHSRSTGTYVSDSNESDINTDSKDNVLFKAPVDILSTESSIASAPVTKSSSGPTGLGLLGSYACSDSDSDGSL